MTPDAVAKQMAHRCIMKNPDDPTNPYYLTDRWTAAEIEHRIVDALTTFTATQVAEARRAVWEEAADRILQISPSSPRAMAELMAEFRRRATPEGG